MRPLRLAIAVVLVAVAAVLALAVHDVLAWRSTLAGTGTSASHLLPGDPARSVLSIEDDLALRNAVHAFVAAESTPRGYDFGESRTRARATAEIALSDIVARGSPARASQAGNLLGVLVAAGGRVTGGVTADDRARGAFEAAVRADPANVDAKYNLELLLRRTRATATRQGPGQGSGALGHGRRGAGSGTPGRGY